jgi:RimJ/RimL family protein N-acetyltransferase
MQESDIEWQREQRNLARQAFFDTHEISKDEQLRWWAKVQLDDRQRWYVIEDIENGAIAGSFGLGPVPHNLPLFGIGKPVRCVDCTLVAPHYRGKRVIMAMEEKLDADASYITHTKADNLASIRSLLRMGFTIKGHFATPYGAVCVQFRE